MSYEEESKYFSMLTIVDVTPEPQGVVESDGTDCGVGMSKMRQEAFCRGTRIPTLEEEPRKLMMMMMCVWHPLALSHNRPQHIHPKSRGSCMGFLVGSAQLCREERFQIPTCLLTWAVPSLWSSVKRQQGRMCEVSPFSPCWK